MATDPEAVATERGLKYFLISFTDLMGVQRAKLVPASSIGGMAGAGAAFAGFATWLDMTPADPDLFAIADPESLIVLRRMGRLRPASLAVGAGEHARRLTLRRGGSHLRQE
jgi:glutamine synthetase